METLAYLVNRKFLLIAADSRYEIEMSSQKITIANARKVHKLNDTNLISVIGNPYKITNINTYINKLTELGRNTTYDEILDNLNDIFNTSNRDLSDHLHSLIDMLPRFYDENGNVKLEDLMAYLSTTPDSLAVLKDALAAADDRKHALTQIMVFGSSPEEEIVKVSHLVTMGDSLFGNENFDLREDFIYIKLASSEIGVHNSITELEKELLNSLKDSLIPGWDAEESQIGEIINRGRAILEEGLSKVSPYTTKPSVVFYECSPQTNYIFKEPDKTLTNIKVTNKQENS